MGAVVLVDVFARGVVLFFNRLGFLFLLLLFLDKGVVGPAFCWAKAGPAMMASNTIATIYLAMAATHWFLAGRGYHAGPGLSMR